MRTHASVLFLYLLLAPVVVAQTSVPGGNVSGIWDISGSPYLVTGELEIIDLQVAPGVSVLVCGAYSLRVTGRLIAEGTVTEPIVFAVNPDSAAAWGGVEFDGTQPGSRLTYCRLENANNSALRVTNCSPEIRFCTFANNSISGSGGGILVTMDNGERFTLRDCIVSDNRATYHGAGILATISGGSELRLESCTLTGNIGNISQSRHATYGGGIYCTGDLSLNDCIVTGNEVYDNTSAWNQTVTAHGGGIYHTTGDLVLVRTKFANNSALAIDDQQGGHERNYNYGGAVYTVGDNLNVVNCTFACNTSRTAGSNAYPYGAGIYCSSTTMNVANCVFYGNSAHGLYDGQGTCGVYNSIFWENYGGGPQIFGPAEVFYCDVQNGFPGTENINVAPVFLDSDCETSGFMVASISPCIDAGHPGFEYNDCCFPGAQGGIRNDMGISGGRYAAHDILLPVIAVTDVTGDQGGALEVSWMAFPEDEPAALVPIEDYLVQVIPPGWSAPVSGWTTIATIPANQSATYSALVAVGESYDAYLEDVYLANSSWPAYLYQVVGTAAGGSVTYVSSTNIGMAIDNIAPAAPNMAPLAESGSVRNIVRLAVDLEATPDFRETCIYRGEILSRDPDVFGEAALWEEPCTFHPEPPIDPCSSETDIYVWAECHRGLYYYVARHVDIHGNYGAASDTLIPQYPAGVDDVPAPRSFALDQNSPNPFNPSTIITFALPTESMVTLDIYGVSGRRVATLIDRVYPPGLHRVAWRGCDDVGREVASGVYFYRLAAGGFTATKRMALIR